MIVVCLTRTVDPATVVVSRRTGEVVQPGKWGVNACDGAALECALRLGESTGRAVAALTVGDASCEDILRDALARGAARAVRVWDDALADADGGVRARTFAAAIQHLTREADAWCAVVAADDPAGVHEQVGVRIAERLQVPVTGDAPAGATAVAILPRADAFSLRLPKAAAVMRAFRAPVALLSPAGDLALSAADLRPAVHVIRTEPRSLDA